MIQQEESLIPAGAAPFPGLDWVLSRRQALAETVLSHGVDRLWLFGSAVRRGAWQPGESDLDLAWWAAPGCSVDPRALEAALESALGGVRVDLLAGEAVFQEGSRRARELSEELLATAVEVWCAPAAGGAGLRPEHGLQAEVDRGASAA